MKKITLLMTLFVLISVIFCGCGKKNTKIETDTAGHNLSSQTENQEKKEITLYRYNIGTPDVACFEKLFKETPAVSYAEDNEGRQRVRMETEGYGETSTVSFDAGYYHDSSSLDAEDLFSSMKNEFYLFNETGDKIWTDYFNTDAECSFLTKKELSEIIGGIIREFGITEYKLEIYTVSEEKFNEYSKWYDVTLSGEAKEISASHFGKYEEFYYARIYPVIDDVTVSDAALGDVDKGEYIQGPYIALSYTEKGVTQLRMINCYDPESVELTDEKAVIISEQDARNKLESKFEKMLVNNVSEYSVSELVLLPYPYTRGGETQYYVLTPFWKFSDGKQLEIYFNAITGEEELKIW